MTDTKLYRVYVDGVVYAVARSEDEACKVVKDSLTAHDRETITIDAHEGPDHTCMELVGDRWLDREPFGSSDGRTVRQILEDGADE
jgi:hypothetical protein